MSTLTTLFKSKRNAFLPNPTVVYISLFRKNYCLEFWLCFIICFCCCVLRYIIASMSQFNYLNEINSIFKMDGDLTVNCPAPRWQKKLESTNTSMLSASINNSKLSMSYNNSYSAMAASLSGKTPQKMGKSPGEPLKFCCFFLQVN